MTLRSRTVRLAALFLIALVSARFAAAQDAPLKVPLQGLDEYISKARAEWEIPGLAIAIVKDDKVVFAKGYGVRKLGDSAPVNERTLFAIGSAGKAFTAAALALLVDEGKIKWDDPVTKHLKGFELYDPYVTREITIRDLLSHRTGFDRGELLWYGSTLDRDEILRRIRHQKPTYSFRSTFTYNNIMLLAAGQIVPAVTGKSWDDFVRERIFTPLGMTASNTSITAFKGLDNVATPHSKLGDTAQAIPWRNVDNIAPAGSINSNALDLAQWIRLQLGEGAYENKKLISSGAVREMHKPQMIIPYNPQAPGTTLDAHFTSYGFGWFLHDYHGRKVVQHGGGIDGMTALVAMAPEERIGVAVLSNTQGNQLPWALMYRVFDAYLGLPPQDRGATLLAARKTAQERAKAAAKKAEDERVKDTKPSLPLGQYAGAYKDEMYGEATVTEGDGKLVFRYSPGFTGELEHWHYETFRVKWPNPTVTQSFVTFTLNAQGKVEDIKAPGMADFKRVPARAAAAAVK
ncbi:MAG TPA: serine hydrolase [Blastocatellia bacterium]|nr:serine hydrolase [Blastocatellia bacterium]